MGGAGKSIEGAGRDDPNSALSSCESSSLAYVVLSVRYSSSSSSSAAKLDQSLDRKERVEMQADLWCRRAVTENASGERLKRAVTDVSNIVRLAMVDRYRFSQVCCICTE